MLSSFQSPEELQQALGARLRAVRLARNLRIADVAAKGGLDNPRIMRLEHGSGSTVDTLMRYLNALGIAEQALAQIAPTPTVSPIALRDQGPGRQRASRRRGGALRTLRTPPSTPEPPLSQPGPGAP